MFGTEVGKFGNTALPQGAIGIGELHTAIRVHVLVENVETQEGAHSDVRRFDPGVAEIGGRVLQAALDTLLQGVGVGYECKDAIDRVGGDAPVLIVHVARLRAADAREALDENVGGRVDAGEQLPRAIRYALEGDAGDEARSVDILLEATGAGPVSCADFKCPTERVA